MVAPIHDLAKAMHRAGVLIAAWGSRSIQSLVMARIRRRHASILRALDDRTLADIGIDRRQLAAYVRSAERHTAAHRGGR